MKGLSTIWVICGLLVLCTGARAQETMVQVASTGRFVIGAQLGLGLQWAARNQDLREGMNEGEMIDIPAGGGSIDVSNSAGFSAGGWVYVDYYLLPMLALEGGIGVLSKGAHYKFEGEAFGFSVEGAEWIKMAHMEIPLGAKLNFKNFRVSALLLFDITLTGKYKIESGDNTEKEKFDDEDWNTFRRFNLGFRLQVGYGIPLGPIVLIPGVDWSTHLIDEIKEDDFEEYQVRWMNFFFNVAAEFTLPI